MTVAPRCTAGCHRITTKPGRKCKWCAAAHNAATRKPRGPNKKREQTSG